MSNKGRKKQSRSLTEKQKKFTEGVVKETIKKLEGDKTAGEIADVAESTYDVSNRNSARTLANENLNKPHIREYMVELLKKHDIGISDVLAIHKRNMNQAEHLPTSQKAVESFYDLLGLKSQPANPGNVNVAFVIEK